MRDYVDLGSIQFIKLRILLTDFSFFYLSFGWSVLDSIGLRLIFFVTIKCFNRWRKHPPLMQTVVDFIVTQFFLFIH